MPGIRLTLCFAVVLCGAACAPPPREWPGAGGMTSVRRVAVEIPDAGEFLTPYRQGQGTSPRAVPDGIVAPPIVGSADARDDALLADRISEDFESTDCRSPLQAALEETLAASRRFETRFLQESYRDEELAGIDALVRIEIEACGFRMLDSERRIYSSFVDLRFRVKTRTDSSGWKSRQSFAGDERATLLELENDGNAAEAEFRRVLRSAGRRLAGELLYP